MFQVYNNTQSVLTAYLKSDSNSIEIIPVEANDPEIWPENGFVTLPGELVYYNSTEKDENGKVCVLSDCTRAIEGTNQEYTVGTPVFGNVVSQQHNQLVEAIIAIEATIGDINTILNEAPITDGMELVASVDHNFSISLHNALAHLTGYALTGDDSCPDVEFIVNTDVPIPGGTKAEYCVRIYGDNNFTFYLDFGDGDYTEEELSGVHTWNSGGPYTPRVSVITTKCTIVQQPSSPGDGFDFAYPTPSYQAFTINIPSIAPFPSFVPPNTICPGQLFNLPPMIVPFVETCSVASMSSISGISGGGCPAVCCSVLSIVGCCIPSVISIEGCCPPSIISIVGCCDIPSVISVETTIPSAIHLTGSIEMPSVISIEGCCPPSIISIVGACDLPSEISITGEISMPATISIEGCCPPSVISMNCCDIPSIVSIIGCHDIPSLISIISDVPSVISLSGQIDMPSSITIEGCCPPSIISIVGSCNIPSIVSIISAEIPSAIHLTGSIEMPSVISIEGCCPPSVISIECCDLPSTISIIGSLTTSTISIDCCNLPSTISIECCDLPSVISLVSALPSMLSLTVDVHLSTVGFETPPSFSPICYCPTPSFSDICFCPTPTFSPIQFAVPPSIVIDVALISFVIPSLTVNVDWGTPPTISCVITHVCVSSSPSPSPSPFAPPMPMPMDGGNFTVNDDFSLGIPEEIKVLVPKIPDIKVIHNLPVEIAVKAPVIPDIRIIGPEKPLPETISIIGNVPSKIKIDATDVPKSIRLDTTDLPNKIIVEPAANFPSVIRVETIGMPDSIRVTGMPSVLEVVGIPKTIQMVMPDDPTIELIYKGPQQLMMGFTPEAEKLLSQIMVVS